LIVSILIKKLGASFTVILFLFLWSQAATAANVLTADRINSKPPNLTQNVPVEKGKQPGLFFRFQCVDDILLNNPTNVCFPIQSTSNTNVTVKIGNSPAINCTDTPGLPGTCSYSFVDAFQHRMTCGPLGNQPCKDTVQIVYNGIFPASANVAYSVSGVMGVGGEFENFANLVTFGTGGDTPSTVSLELVFDVSGSMDLAAVPGGTIKRIKALQDSTQVLFGILNSYALPGNGVVPGDKLGAVFFSTSAIPNATPPACSGMLVSNLVDAANPTKVQAISHDVNQQVPTLLTSIGAGLQSAACGFTQETSPKNANRQVLLFSDGEQNTAPKVQVVKVANNNDVVQVSDSAGANFVNYPSNSAALCPAGVPTPCVRICPVTAGRLTAPGFALQQAIADAACSGNNAHIRDADPANPDPTSRDPQTFVQADLETFFVQSLTTIVTSDKLEIVADTIGTVPPGRATIEKFIGASNDVRMTIALSWSPGPGHDRILTFQLKAPDGTLIDLTNRTTVGHNMSVTTILFPLFEGNREIARAGEWQIVISGESIQSDPCKYHLIVMADNPTVVSDFIVNVKDVGVGEPIPIQVKLTDNGIPVLNASVEAQIMGPSNSQGNILSRTPISSLAGPGPDPASTKGQGKLNALYADSANISLFADTGLPAVPLRDGGSNGVYTGSFIGTSKEGHYYVTIRVRGHSATAGAFQRTFWLARFVRSKPDPNNTHLTLLSSVRQIDGSVLVKLQAIPRDSFGNFLGPGYEKDMRITSTSGTIDAALDDKLDGSYEITYRLLSQSSNPSFTLQIMGVTVKTETLKQLTLSHWAASLDFGAGIPHGTFGNAFNTGFSLNAGLENMFNAHFSAEGIFGYHHFPGKFAGSLDVYQFSANAKIYLTPPSKVRPFVNFGPGGYKFNPGSANFGGNAGGGVLFELTPRFGLQGSYNFHAVNTSGAAAQFSTLQGGMRFVF
jgi:hypothetical protein